MSSPSSNSSLQQSPSASEIKSQPTSAQSSSTVSVPSNNSSLPNVASVCPLLKVRYERCFQLWYSDEFLHQKSTSLPCESEYEEYKKCVKQQLTKEGIYDEAVKNAPQVVDLSKPYEMQKELKPDKSGK